MVSLTRRDVIGGTAALAASGAIVAARAGETSGGWLRLSDAPVPLQGITPAPFRRAGAPRAASLLTGPDVFVVAGGMTDAPGFASRVSHQVMSFDPAPGIWKFWADLPWARHHLALVAHDGSLYGFGGYYADAGGLWRIKSELWRLDDLAQPKWFELPSQPIAQAEGALGSLVDGVHIAGGRIPLTSRQLDYSDYVDTDLHWAFVPSPDPAASRWEQRRPMPTSRFAAAGVVYLGALYVIGGRTTHNGNSDAFEVYEPRGDRWQSFRALPRAIRQKSPRGQSDLAAAVFNRCIYVFGGEWYDDGEKDGGLYSDVWEYDLKADKWRAVEKLSVARHGHGAVAMNGGVYVVGGALVPGYPSATAIVEKFVI
jgi:hypothetical protein